MDNEEPPSANGDAEAGGDDGNKPQEEAPRPAGMREIIVRLVALGNFGLQGVNIGVLASKAAAGGSVTAVASGMVYGSSGLGAAHSPVVVYKERQLTKEDTFRNALNGIREEQGRLTEQNDILSAEIDDLQSEVDRMKDVEMALRELSETQGSQLDELMDLINENKKINEGLRDTLKSKALEEVIGLVLDIDNDGSFTIQDREIDRLIIGMKLIEGIAFEDNMFRQEVMACDGNVDEVILMIKTMIRGGGDGRNTDCTIEIEADPEEFFNKKRGTIQ